jgi:outer membrane receptor protein involved in Fe transport
MKNSSLITTPILKIVIVTILVLSVSISAQVDSVYNLEEDVIISASRIEQNSFATSEAVSALSYEQIELSSPMNMASSLLGTNGVWMQQTNNGGGSPFVRGLTGNQTLIMIDGIRLNNSTFRYGPNQYLNTLNIDNTQRIEVMRGSGSVQYGSDALGGVVHIISKTPSLNPNGNILNFSANTKYLSSNMEKSGTINLGYAGKKNAVTGFVSYKNIGDIVAGGSIGKQIPSSYNELAASVKSIHQISDSYLMILSYDYVEQTDVDRYDQVTQRGYEYHKFDPQIRHLAYIKNNFTTNSNYFSDIIFTLSWQKSDETRIKKKTESIIETTENDVVNVFGSNLEFVSSFSNIWKANSGIEFYYDYVNSSKNYLDLSSGIITPSRGLYADESSAMNFSLYTLHNINLNKFDFNFGVRYNANSININDNEFGDVSISPMAFTGHVSLQYYLTQNLQIIGRINSAYRTPNINDLSSFGSFDYGIEVPNDDLSPEQSLNFEIGLKAKSKQIVTSLFIYRNNLSNLIDRVRSTYNGSPTYDGENVYTKVNVGKAFVEGIEGDLTFYLNRMFSLYSSINYTYGQNVSKDEPMRRIPPLNGNVTVNYQNKMLKLSAQYLFATTQDRLSSGDIDDHRIPDGGTPGWQVLNLYSSYKISSFLVSVGLLNIFNEAYKTHGSGINGIGRSIFVDLKFSI